MSLADITPTRRALVARAGLLATVAAAGTCAAVAHVAAGDTTLLALGAELDAVHRQRVLHLVDHPEDDADPFYDPHWALRDKINGVPATNHAELKVKARAAAYAYENDPTAECDVSGSFVELSRSLIADLLRLQQSAA